LRGMVGLTLKRRDARRDEKHDARRQVRRDGREDDRLDAEKGSWARPWRGFVGPSLGRNDRLEAQKEMIGLNLCRIDRL
jgi:hypothetical protein